MWLNLIIFILFFPLFFVRWILWLAIFQQKEYRVDRLRAYLKTSQGKTDIIKLWPSVQDFSRESLKRPKLTARVVVLVLFSAGLIILPLKFVFSWRFYQAGLSLLILLAAVPLMIFLANIPLVLFKTFLTSVFLWLAKHKIKLAAPTIIGITGSYGKTSTKHLLCHILSSQAGVFASARSFNTPLSLSLDILRRYKKEKIVILEYAAYKPGEIKKLANIFQPHLAIITGFTTQHLATFGTREKIIQAKAELILALPAKSTVFFNQDDEGVRAIVDYALSQSSTELEYQPFVASTEDDTTIEPQIDNKGRLKLYIDQYPTQSQLIGKHYLSIILGAAVVAKHLKVSSKQIATAISTFKPDNSFVKFFRHQQGFWVIDDGRTSNPVGFEAALDLAEQLLEKRQFTGNCVLFTCGIVDLGEVSKTTHQKLAKKAIKVFSQVAYLGEPGRKEFREVYQDKLLENKEKIKALLPLLTVNDLVLVEGRLPIWLATSLEINQ